MEEVEGGLEAMEGATAEGGGCVCVCVCVVASGRVVHRKPRGAVLGGNAAPACNSCQGAMRPPPRKHHGYSRQLGGTG